MDKIRATAITARHNAERRLRTWKRPSKGKSAPRFYYRLCESSLADPRLCQLTQHGHSTS